MDTNDASRDGMSHDVPNNDAPPQKTNPRVLLALHALLVVFSLNGVMSKLAAQYPFMSGGFIFYYGLMVVVLGIYAIGWQQIIKRMPLTTAYANRAITVVWGIVWGALIFGEQVTWQKVVGALVVLVGVALYAVADHAAGGKDGEGQ